MTTRATPRRRRPSPTAYALKRPQGVDLHAGHADYYTTFARTSDDGGRGLSCFVVPADAAGHRRSARPERKMGLHCDTVREVHFDGVHGRRRPPRRAAEGQGMAIALSALDAGRLGIAAAATGLAQSALDLAADYAKERAAVRPADRGNQGLAFLLADMEAAVTSGAGDLPARGPPARTPAGAFSKEAAVAKLICTDAAMRVTTDAVQVLGGAGYTQDFPLERYMREAKVTQIFEGTNQIQRLVISRQLLRG